MTRVAAVDCGTNSLRLLVADVVDGRLRDVHRQARVVRLGEGVDASGRLAPSALGRLRAGLADYAALAAGLGVDLRTVVATSAVRDARNRAEFVAVVQEAFGVEPVVVSGRQEAALGLAGVRAGLPAVPAAGLCVVDVGGGSTEVALEAAGTVRAHSMDVGSVRLAERHLIAAPPTAAQIAAARADVRIACAQAPRPGPEVTVVGVAATALTVVALAAGHDRLDPQLLDGARVSAAEVGEVTGRLLTATPAQLAAEPAINPDRAPVIAAGALVLDTVLTELGVGTLHASVRDLLDGAALAAG